MTTTTETEALTAAATDLLIMAHPTMALATATVRATMVHPLTMAPALLMVPAAHIAATMVLLTTAGEQAMAAWAHLVMVLPAMAIQTTVHLIPVPQAIAAAATTATATAAIMTTTATEAMKTVASLIKPVTK